MGHLIGSESPAWRPRNRSSGQKSAALREEPVLAAIGVHDREYGIPAVFDHVGLLTRVDDAPPSGGIPGLLTRCKIEVAVISEARGGARPAKSPVKATDKASSDNCTWTNVRRTSHIGRAHIEWERPFGPHACTVQGRSDYWTDRTTPDGVCAPPTVASRGTSPVPRPPGSFRLI